MQKFNKGDKVFVIDWGKLYSEVTGKNGVFFECPIYSSYSFFFKFIYEGEGKKRKVKERIPVYKNFKYEVVDFKYHPKAGEISTNWRTPEKPNEEVWYYTKLPIYLLKSQNSEDFPHDECYVEVEEGGLSLMTPEQYKDEQFNALKEYNRKKWKINDNLKEFPNELVEKVYDKNDNVLFGSSIVKGLITYEYIPAEYTIKGNPIIKGSSCSYDGKGNSQLPATAILVNWQELPKMFPENEFSYTKKL